jgi:ferredoxin-NADP reductase
MLVAGGSGLVPLMAMLRHRRLAGSDAPCRLLLSARRPEDVLFAGELDTIGGEVAITYTRAAPAGWAGFTGRVDRAMLAAACWPPTERARTFVCGPTGFVEAVADDLLALGHAPGLIRTERFGASGE